jgi:hypothetical protein
MKKKTLPKLKKEALDLFSQLIKLEHQRDGKMKCFTCDKPLQPKTTDCQLGHFLPRGAYPGLTFNRDNVRLQCMRCNVWLHGNVFEFRARLINELGEQRVLELEAMRHETVKLGRSDYLRMIQELKEEIKKITF